MAIVFDEPLRNFRFLIDFESESGTKIAAAFTQFSGIKMQVEYADVRDGSNLRGVVDGVPALTSFENVQLTKGVIGEHEFFDWILAAAPGAINHPTGEDLSRTINIVALDDKGKRAITWSLYDAVPVSYQLSPMDSVQNAVLTETVEFSINGFTRETHE